MPLFHASFGVYATLIELLDKALYLGMQATFRARAFNHPPVLSCSDKWLVLLDLWVRSLAEHLYFAVEAEKRGKGTIGIDIRNGIRMNIVITEMWKFLFYLFT